MWAHVCGAQMGLTWSDAPLAAAYSHPYVVALLPGHVEIRSVQDLTQEGLAQVLLPVRQSPSGLFALLPASTTAPSPTPCWLHCPVISHAWQHRTSMSRLNLPSSGLWQQFSAINLLALRNGRAVNGC